MGTPTSSQTGGIVSAFTGGAIPGALSVAWLPDKFGRKRTVFIGSCISILGCALQGGAKNIPMMIAGRFISGIAVGLLSAVVPMYCVSGFWKAYGLDIDLTVSPKLQLRKIEESSVVYCNGCCLGAFLLRNGSDTDASRSRATFNVSNPPCSQFLFDFNSNRALPSVLPSRSRIDYGWRYLVLTRKSQMAHRTRPS
jgi:hypothetical protein